VVYDGERNANKDEKDEESRDGESDAEDELDGSQDAFDAADAVRNMDLDIDGDLIVTLGFLDLVFGDRLCLD
jgi:hypothetical protein